MFIVNYLSKKDKYEIIYIKKKERLEELNLLKIHICMNPCFIK